MLELKVLSTLLSLSGFFYGFLLAAFSSLPEIIFKYVIIRRTLISVKIAPQARNGIIIKLELYITYLKKKAKINFPKSMVNAERDFIYTRKESIFLVI